MKIPNFDSIIAEEPYDEMGLEFQRCFGHWINETNARKDGDTPEHFQKLAFSLFKLRLALAQKFNTYFARQVVNGTRELWRERYTGSQPGYCYSFAIKDLPRTLRFYDWCLKNSALPNAQRIWDEKIKPIPSLPLAPHETYPNMPVWAHLHEPQFRARQEGPFYVRRINLGPTVHLIEHPDNQWVSNLRQEAQEYWFRANDPKRSIDQRVKDLASFEWLWFWLNPFGRAGALTGDSLSLITQKQMLMDGLNINIRPGYYHQDCEAFLLSWHDYIHKRTCDLLLGFNPRFSMNITTITITK